MTNPKAGHTSASSMGSNSQGLRDGDGLMSPSLTNLYEGLHGNGIMRLGDGAKGDSLRNSIVANTPGFIEIGASQGEIKVYGGHCILDGVMYEFAGGPGANETFIIGTTGAGANHSGDLPSVPASNSDVFVVVYLVGRSTPEAHLMYEMGTPAAPSSGTPLIPSRFLSIPSITGNTDANHQTTVLGVLRYTMTGGAGSVTSSLSASPTIFDRRTYLRTSPMYLTPMTKGSIGNVDKANALTNPDSFFSSPENGDFGGSTFGAIWHSHTEDYSSNKHGVLYAALPRNLNTTPVTNTYALGDRLEVITTTGNVTFEFHQGNIWIVTTDAARTINPSGTFPVGHTVEIYHKAGAHTLHFDSTVGGHGATPINVNIGVNEYGRFTYDGTNWQQISTVTAGTPVASSGANGLVQLSDGAGGFTSDSTLSYDTAANELTVDGKLTVTGLIDPTGMVFTPQATNPESTNPEDTIWIDSETNHLFRGNRNVESTVHFNVRNDEGATIPLGAPLYSKGEIGGSNRIKVGIADASDPNKMPAIGLAMQEMNTTSTKDGNMILTGILNENITITGVVEQDIIYVAPHGGSAPYLTITRPTSPSHLVQNVGVCVRQSATNVSQGMKVAAIGRTNDSPNCSFLMVNTESTHPQARRLVAGTNITLTDGGAGGDLTIAATAYTDADAVAAVETEAGLDFSTSSNDAIVENTAQDKDIIFKINDGGTPTEVLRIDGSTGNVGIRLNQNVTADERLDVEDGNISLTTTSRTTERLIKLRNSGSTTSLSEIAMAGANSNNYEGYIAFKTKGPDDLYNDPLNEIMRIDGNGNVGIGTTSPDTKLHIEASSNPTLKLQETGQNGYLEITSVVDSQAKITATNETASEFMILDIDAKANASTGTFQDVRVFRNAQSTVDGNFRIKQVGTATDVFHVYSDKDGTAHTMTMNGSAQITSDLEIDGALNHDGSTVGFFGTGPQTKTAVSALGGQVVTPSPGEPTAADLTATQNAINALQVKLDALISSLSNLGLV